MVIVLTVHNGRDFRYYIIQSLHFAHKDTRIQIDHKRIPASNHVFCLQSICRHVQIITCLFVLIWIYYQRIKFRKFYIKLWISNLSWNMMLSDNLRTTQQWWADTSQRFPCWVRSPRHYFLYLFITILSLRAWKLLLVLNINKISLRCKQNTSKQNPILN